MIIGISGKIGSGKDTVGKIIQCIIYAEQTELYKKDTKFIKECFDIDNGDNVELTIASKWEIKKFADYLKDIVCGLIGCTKEQLENREFKEKELGKEWNKYIIFNVIDNYIYSIFDNWYEAQESLKDIQLRHYRAENKKLTTIEVKEEQMTPRLLLQLMGTECGRNIIHPNVWVNALMSKYKMSYVQHKDIEYVEHKQYPNWIITDTRFPNELQAVKDRGGVSIRVNRGRTGGEILEDKNSEHPSETSLDTATFDYVIHNDGSIEELIEKVKEILIKEKII